MEINISFKKVFLNSLFFLFCCFSSASAANLYLSPPLRNVSKDQVFNLTAFVSSSDQAMNAVSGSLSFPSDKLEVLSVLKTGSIINFWVQEPVFSNSLGTVNFEGVVLNPGYKGSSGQILTIQFKAKNIGTAPIQFSSGTVLANDGQGTNILSSFAGSQVSIQGGGQGPGSDSPSLNLGAPGPVEILSSTHPDQNSWYSLNRAEFSWKISSEITGIRTLYDHFPRSQPTEFLALATSSKEYSNIPDGVWYFHIQLRNKNGWGAVSHFRFQVDVSSPKNFEVEFLGDKENLEVLPKVKIKAFDEISGIEYYKIGSGAGDFKKLLPEEIEKKEYVLNFLDPGENVFFAQAFDRAGNFLNFVEEIYVSALETPVIEDYPKTLVRGDILVVKGYSIYSGEIVEFKIFKDDQKLKDEGSVIDQAGIFVFTLDDPVEPGIYKISARVKSYQGAESFYTDQILIPVNEQFINKEIDSFFRAIGYFMAVVSVLISIVLLLFYLWKRLRLWWLAADDKLSESHVDLIKIFNEFKTGVEKQVGLLDSIKTWHDQTEEEKQAVESLKTEIQKAETLVKEEIEDIRNIK